MMLGGMRTPSVPAIATVAIFTFIWSYNDLFLQTVLLRSRKLLPVCAILREISSQYGTDFGLMAAAVTIVMPAAVAATMTAAITIAMPAAVATTMAAAITIAMPAAMAATVTVAVAVAATVIAAAGVAAASAISVTVTGVRGHRCRRLADTAPVGRA